MTMEFHTSHHFTETIDIFLDVKEKKRSVDLLLANRYGACIDTSAII